MAVAGTANALPINLIQNGGFEAATTFEGWTVIDQDNSAGTWCPQTGTDAPGIDFTKGGISCGGDEGSGATVPPPPEGAMAAMMDQGEPAASALIQCVNIPGDAPSAELSFQLYLLNLEEEWITHPTLDLFPGGPPKKQSIGDRFSVSGNGKGSGDNQQFRADIISPAGVKADPFTIGVLQNVYQTQPGDPLESGYTLITADLSAYIGQSVCVRFVVVDNSSYLNAGIDDVKVLVDDGVEPTPGQPTLDVKVSDENPSTGEDVEVTAEVLDANGNPVVGAECTFSIASQPGDDATVDAGPVATDAEGHATTTLHTGSTAGTIEVEADCDGLTQVLAVEVGAGVTAPGTGSGGQSPSASSSLWLALAALVATTVVASTLAFARRR
jgi:hypothetical protein